jgi:hypothetical protein
VNAAGILTMSETITVTLTLTKEEAKGLAILMNASATIRDACVDAVSLWKDEGTRLLWPTEQSGNVYPIPRMYAAVPKVDDEPALLDAMERAGQKVREALADHVSIEWADDVSLHLDRSLMADRVPLDAALARVKA